MALSLLSLAKTYALTIGLGVAAAVLVALVALFALILRRIYQKQKHLSKTEVYTHILRVKPQIAQDVEENAKSEKAKKKKGKQNADRQQMPKRGKKNKKPKFVFASDIKAADLAGSGNESGAKCDDPARSGDEPEAKEYIEEGKEE